MTTYSFIISCRPTDERDHDEIIDALFEAGCDDALVTERFGTFVVDFDREATTFAKAFFSAINAVCAAGLLPLRVGPDPLVNASEIAARANLTRQAVSNYVTGKRGSGFPTPFAQHDTPSPLWRWHDVACWLAALKTTQVNHNAILRAHWIDRANNVVLPKVIERAKRKAAHAA
jgi:hypothetical protein